MLNDKQFIVARYEYDPFGNILSKSGPLADANLYRFSSQEYHQNSGLLLYLYRAYDPNLQRFINRDPIEELGGINLYGFVDNNPMGRVDLWGLDDDDPDDPTSDENLAKGNNGAMQLKAKDCHEAAKNTGRVGRAVLEGGANACTMFCPVGGAGKLAAGGKGLKTAETVAADANKIKNVAQCLKKWPKHHPWPKYLKGLRDQTIKKMPRKLHEQFHRDLDAWKNRQYSRQWGAEHFKDMDPEKIINELHDFYNNFGGGKYRQYLADFEQAVKETLEAAE